MQRGSVEVRLGPADAGRCRRRVHLDHDPTADRSRRRAPDPGLQLRYDTLADHREAVHAALAAVLPLDESGRPPDGDAAADRPVALWSPRLVSQTRFASPDLLLRADILTGAAPATATTATATPATAAPANAGTATSGTATATPAGPVRDTTRLGYHPVLVRGHRTTDPGTGARFSALDDIGRTSTSRTKKLRSHHADVLALAHVFRLLQDLGLAAAPIGGIIGRGGPAADADWDDGAIVVWHDLTPVLADYDTAMADRLAVARAAAERRPALAFPSKVAECRRCPWWTVCGPELQAQHDVSLLAAGPDVELLRARGISSYDDVAALDPADAAALPLTSIPPSEISTRARAMVVGVPLVRRAETVAPTRADVELDVDMESYSDDGAYLWGTYLTGAAPPAFARGYRPFVTWEGLDTDAAAGNFVTFWHYLTALREACSDAGRTFAAYCYSHQAEERWLYGTPARFPHVPGMPDRADVAEFCSSAQWVDLYVELKRAFIVQGSMRLKRVAPIAGFSWRDPEPGGENSMAWYRIAAGYDAAPEPDVAAHRRRILRYNEDDVLATLRLRQWMSEHATDMPTRGGLDALFAAVRRGERGADRNPPAVLP